MPSRTFRDAGLHRVGRGTRLLALGSILAAGLFSLVAARVHPGSSHRPTGAASGVTAPGGTGATQAPGLSTAPAPGATSRVPVAHSAPS